MQEAKKNQGFTLIELMVTIALIAIIAGMAAPMLNNMLLSQNLNKSTQTMISVLSEARSQAVLTRQEVKVDFDIDQTEPTANQKEEMNNKILFGWNPSGKAELTNSVNPVTFDMTGKLNSSTTDVVIEICEKNGGSKSKIVTISRIGTIQRIGEGTC